MGAGLAAVLMLLAAGLLLAGRGARLALSAGGGDSPPHRGANTRLRRHMVLGVAAVALLAVVSLPLAAGAVLGWVTRKQPLHVVTGAAAGALGFAALIALSGAGSVVVPPVGSDVVVAVVVGVVCGRAMVRA